MRRAVAIVATAIALCTSAFAQTPEQQQAIERAERIGRDIDEHDRAAWLGTDAIRADMGDAIGARMRGWITERDGDQIIVTFVTEDGGELRSLYRATLRNGALTARGESSAPLSEAQLRLYRARQAATRSGFAGCSRTYNTVTLPNADGQTADVYPLPGTTDRRVVLVGGAYRVRVDLQNATVLETQAFSRSCLTLQRDPAVNEQLLYFTHLTTPMPTETHVFLNLSLGLPLAVGTPDGLWSIENGRISALQESAH